MIPIILQGLTSIAALVAAFLSFRAVRQAKSMFDTQRRPWLYVELEAWPNHEVKIDYDSGAVAGRLVLRNYGQGAARHIRTKLRFTSEASSTYAGTAVWPEEVGTRGDIRAQELLMAPGEKLSLPYSPYCELVKKNSPGRAFLHVYLDFRGCETQGRYYFEQIFAFDFPAGPRVPKATSWPVAAYFGSIRHSEVVLE